MNVASIKLTKGFSTEVDDELFEELNQFSWYASGLEPRPARRLRLDEDVDRKLIYIYHQILGIKPWITDKVVDHIDGNPLNNRRSNLRVITQFENSRSRKTPGTGIAYDKTYNRWKVYVDTPTLTGKTRKNVGTYLTKQDAEEARNAYLKGQQL